MILIARQPGFTKLEINSMFIMSASVTSARQQKWLDNDRLETLSYNFCSGNDGVITPICRNKK